MARKTVKLTKRVIDRLTTTQKRGEMTFDTEVKGLAVRVWPSGRRAFTLDYGPREHRRRFTIAAYGVLTLDDARIEALRLIGDIAKGNDPLDDRAEQRAAPFFGEWVKTYLASLEGHKKQTSIDMDKLYLDRASERWKKRALKEISVRDVQRFYDAQKKRGRCTANRTLASLRTCLGAAWRMDLLPENVALKVKPLPESPPRTRVLSEKEHKRLVKAVNAVKDPHVRAAFQLLLETGARRSEVLNMRWENLDLDDVDRATWYLPNPKRQRPETKPLTRGMAEMLLNLPRKSEYVIAGRYPDRPRPDLKKQWVDLRDKAKLKDVRVHDIRRTFGLEVARKAGLHVASKLLGHSSVRVTERVYAPLGIDELREAAETVSRERLAKVLPFRKTSAKADGD